LTELLEDPSTSSPSEKLVLLLEIADDAQRLKMGSEDKIRVAGKACEEVRPLPLLPSNSNTSLTSTD
jgi:inhibitor of growth protein 3